MLTHRDAKMRSTIMRILAANYQGLPLSKLPIYHQRLVYLVAEAFIEDQDLVKEEK